jgi:mxaJ protein
MRRIAGLTTTMLVPPLLAAGLVFGSAAPSSFAEDGHGMLRVCADPDNLPFSDAKGGGFENKLAELVAGDLGERVSYTWVGQGQDPVKALQAGQCDVVMGIPTQLGRIDTTTPYYWSSYVFVSRADRGLDITSVKDARLKQLKIGVDEVRGDRFATPPAHMLGNEGLAQNILGYPIGGAQPKGSAQARVIECVARGDIDRAAVWGPRGGYFARQAVTPLTVSPIADTEEFSTRKPRFELADFQYDISMGVRKGDDARRAALNEVILRKRLEIRALLENFGVPLIEPPRAIREARE